MRVHIYFVTTILLIISGIQNSVAQEASQTNMGHFQGEITAINLEEGHITVGDEKYGVSPMVSITDTNNNRIDLSALNQGQNIAFWINNSAKGMNPTLTYSIIDKIRILSELDASSITH